MCSLATGRVFVGPTCEPKWIVQQVARLLQTPALRVRRTWLRDRAGGSPAKVSLPGGTAAVNFATGRRNLQSTAPDVPAARRKPIFAYFLAACKK
jgi:hypothetical protein